MLTDLLRSELDRAMPGKRQALAEARDPGAMWRAIGVRPPAADPEADGWARGLRDSLLDSLLDSLRDSLREDDGAGQAAA